MLRAHLGEFLEVQRLRRVTTAEGNGGGCQSASRREFSGQIGDEEGLATTPSFCTTRETD